MVAAASNYCYQATPASAQGGVRSFSGDSSAIVAQSNTSTNCCQAAGLTDFALCGVLR
jgi:hypothetical protein